MITEKTKRALQIIAKNSGIRPREFAKLFWPDKWMNGYSRCGNGVTKGGGYRLAAGGYLGKLAQRGLIRHYTDGYAITSEGRAAIEHSSVEAA